MEEDDEGIDDDDDDDDGKIRDDWHEPTVVQCEVSQGTRNSTTEEDVLSLVWEEVERARHNSYTPGQRCIGRERRRPRRSGA
ncbi:hypothetical protein AMTR_s00013p00249360 [Amborella trichopoda]|uniref:Uncharacterized protein n=1 Tax=Amborella trichopoda TaxID=13333 RepID=W1PJ73_AMBTC|nr:hypothetical protein AMTR_s00013p00249360 [Amborella trichopoda]